MEEWRDNRKLVLNSLERLERTCGQRIIALESRLLELEGELADQNAVIAAIKAKASLLGLGVGAIAGLAGYLA